MRSPLHALLLLAICGLFALPAQAEPPASLFLFGQELLGPRRLAPVPGTAKQAELQKLFAQPDFSQCRIYATNLKRMNWEFFILTHYENPEKSRYAYTFVARPIDGGADRRELLVTTPELDPTVLKVKLEDFLRESLHQATARAESIGAPSSTVSSSEQGAPGAQLTSPETK
jgi:hypothetical protein